MSWLVYLYAFRIGQKGPRIASDRRLDATNDSRRCGLAV